MTAVAQTLFGPGDYCEHDTGYHPSAALENVWTAGELINGRLSATHIRIPSPGSDIIQCQMEYYDLSQDPPYEVVVTETIDIIHWDFCRQAIIDECESRGWVF